MTFTFNFSFSGSVIITTTITGNTTTVQQIIDGVCDSISMGTTFTYNGQTFTNESLSREKKILQNTIQYFPLIRQPPFVMKSSLLRGVASHKICQSEGNHCTVFYSNKHYFLE
jgi:hypothetical protein